MLNYKILPVCDLSSAGWDGMLFVGNKDSIDGLPDNLKTPLLNAGTLDESFHSGVHLVSTTYKSGRLFYSSFGKLNPDYHDIRSFAEAAESGMKAAIKAGVKSIIIILMSYPEYPQSKMVTVLGALNALYMPIHYQEAFPHKGVKVTKVGIWSKEVMNLDNFIRTITALESGRIVARDIGGGDPERMSPPMIEDYIVNVFPPNRNVTVEVIKDPNVLEQEYPLFSAVNRAAKSVKRHAGRIIHLTYSGPNAKDSIFLVGKGVTYDTGGADLKVNGVMAGMSRDKCGAAAVAGFLKVVSTLAPNDIRVVGALSLVRNSVGEECYVADEMIKSRSGKLVRIGNTDAEGRMIMADVLCQMKDLALNYKFENPHLMTIATLTGHAYLTVGPGYTIAMDNGPARKSGFSHKLQMTGERMGDMIELSTVRREDYKFNAGKNEFEDLVQANTQPSSRTPRGHQIPAAFLTSVSGLDKHGLESEEPLKYTHLDIAASSGDVPDLPTGAPILALSSYFLNLSC